MSPVEALQRKHLDLEAYVLDLEERITAKLESIESKADS